MKKIFTFCAVVLLSASCYAQLQNGNFEIWNSITLPQINEWATSNGETLINGLPPNVIQYTPAQEGDYSVRLATVSTLSDTILGYVANSPNPFDGEGGVPYTMQPDSVICYAKTGLQPGDSAVLLVMFKNAGSPLGINLFKIGGNNTSVWQRLAFKLGSLAMAPDTVIIGVASSDPTAAIYIPGSFIIIDDLAFTAIDPIPGGDFENWSVLTFESLANFLNPNIPWVLNGMSPPVLKTTDSYLGDFALRVKTQSGGPGWMFTGFNNGNWNPAIMDYTGGFAYNQQIDTLVGWYKYFPTDTAQRAQVNINFQIGDTTFASANYRLKNTDTYTKFEIPFNLPMSPDTAIITINSSEWPVGIEDTGSILIIDEIQFKSAPLSTGIENISTEPNVLIYPNPTEGMFDLIYTPKNSNSSTYSIYDGYGKEIINNKLKYWKTTINLSGNSKGIYYLKVIDDGHILCKKIILR